MKKLRLDVDELQVEAFPTTETSTDEKGTVFAHSLNPNCGLTEAGGDCLVSGSKCIPWSYSPYCDETYACNSATDCSFANTACCWVITD